MFDFVGSPVPVRKDLRDTYADTWGHLASPGPTLTGVERIGLADYVRAASCGDTAPWVDLHQPLLHLATTLFINPGLVDRAMVRTAAEVSGDPRVVEVISIVSMLAAIDGTHRALHADLEPLPAPLDGPVTGVIAEGLKQRRTHVPMPRGAIPVALDLLPDEGTAFQALFGPQYMTGSEMALDDFSRAPGLSRDQMELISSRTSLHNKCFY
jgi:hypothetical protein